MRRFHLTFSIGPLALVAIAIGMFAHPIVAQDNSRILISADTVHTMDGKTLSPGQVLVEDGKISSVGEKIDISGKAPRIIELGSGSVLMPGLVDAYSQTGLGEDGSDEITDEVTPGFRAIDSVDWDKPALKRQLHAGTTTMCVCPGRQNVFGGIAAIIKTGEIGTPLINDDGPLVANLCSDPASGNRSRSRPDTIFVRQPTNRMGVVWILRKTFDKVKRGEDPNGYPEIEEVLDQQRPLMMFARVSHDIQTVATLADEFGYSPIIVGGQEAYKVKEMLAERNYPVILQNNGTGSISGSENSKLCWNNAGVLDQAGITFAFSGNELLEQARFAHRYGLGKEKALAAITTTPAQLLGIGDRVGKIAKGHDADLVALSGDPLELTTSIRWVMVNGQTFGMEKE